MTRTSLSINAYKVFQTIRYANRGQQPRKTKGEQGLSKCNNKGDMLTTLSQEENQLAELNYAQRQSWNSPDHQTKILIDHDIIYDNKKETAIVWMQNKHLQSRCKKKLVNLVKTCRFLGKKFTGYYKKTKQSHQQVNNNHQIYEYKIKT